VSGERASDRGAGDERALDCAARRIAQERFDAPIWIEAGAGTGKTAVLVARIVVWCLGRGWERSASRIRRTGRQPASPERVAADTLRRVVAITFTEAAAAEMAVRVMRALLQVERGEDVVGIDVDLLPLDAARRAARARALVGALDQLSVHTIHAWCRRLLASHALEARLHPRFEVDADERMLRQTAREVVEGRLQEAYGERGDDAAFALAERGFGPAELEAALVGLLQAGVPAARLASDPLSSERVAAYLGELASATARFAEIEAGRLARLSSSPAVARTAASVARSLALARAAQPSRAGLEAFVAELRRLWDRNDVGRMRDFARGKLEKGAAGAIGSDAPALAAAAREASRRLDHALTLDPELLSLGHRVMGPLLAAAERALRERGVETFSGLLRDALSLLRSSVEVASRVRREMDQLLVDEFQDTDALQCEILRVLALEGEVEERPGLFLVGDPKQSIYGWRNADLRAYEGFLEAVRAAGGQGGRLCVNYRSAPEILAEVERAIAPLMQREPGLQPEFQRLLPGAVERGAGAGPPRVEHWVSWGFDRDAGAPDRSLRAADVAKLEARALARDLARYRCAGGSLDAVGLLLRTLGDADLYLHELRRAGIPYVIERDRHYHERREVIDARALVRAVLDPHDQLALVAVLRSALVGAPDAALVPLWRCGFPTCFARLASGRPGAFEETEKAVREAAAATPRDVPRIERVEGWQESLLAFAASVARLREAHAREAPDRFVERLRAELLLEASEAARPLGPHRVANLDRFFRDLAAALAESGGDASAVVAALRTAVSDAREQEEGRPRDAAGEAVRVLTLHGAKGLEFERVYVLQLHKGRGADPRSEVGVARRGAEIAVRLFGQATLDFPKAAADRERVEEAERVRTLYVAMTRAKRRLVLAGRRGGPERDSHAGLLARRVEERDLAAWMRELADSEGPPFRDEDGARFFFPALDREREPAVAGAPARAAWPDGAALRVLSRTLARRREAARALSERPFHATASEEEGESASERAEAGYGPDLQGAAPPRIRRSEAQAVGSAIHAWLELADLEAARDQEGRARLAGALERLLPRDLSPRARSWAAEVRDAFLAGPLFARALAASRSALSRELPVLLGPAALRDVVDAGSSVPVGFASGAIDLVYRDPATGELVVADYKTDRISAADVPARAALYRGQGRIYTRALQVALGLGAPPRFELWFLVPGVVATIAA
jgi:ATP-dependent helicase/nuclease subunit A